MKHLIIHTAAILFLTLSIQLTGQTFQKTYGSVVEDKGSQVLLTSDNNYAIIGVSQEKSGICLIKVDSKGKTIWEKKYGPPNMLSYYSNTSFKQTKDNGFIITGSVRQTMKDAQSICLIKTNALGDTLWTKSYGPSDSNFPGALAYEIIITADGGYAIVGTEIGFHTTNVFLIKTDSNGNVQWAKNYGGANDEEGYSLKQAADGSYIIAGYTTSFPPDHKNLYLLKVNSTGNLLWARTYQGKSYSYANHIEIIKDGGFIMIGESRDDDTGGSYDSDLFLMKTDSAGNNNFAYLYGGNLHETGTSVKQTSDGGFIATGYTASSGAGQEDVYLLRTDVSGNVVWVNNYGGPSTERGNDVIQVGGNFLIAGETKNFSKGMKDVYLIKTDNLGNGTCKQGTATAIKIPMSWTQGSGGTENSGSTIRSNTIVLSNPDTASYNACDCVPPVAKFSARMLDVSGHMANYSTWATTWHWDFGNGDTSNVEEPDYNWNAIGTFKVCLTVKNSCGSDSVCQIVTTGTGINELKNNQLKLSIAPNPFTNYTNIEFKNPKKEKLNLQLLNTLGQAVLQINNITEDKVQIDRNGLPKGIYFIQVLKDNQIVGADKVIIE